MRVEATASDALAGILEGRAIGDEFDLPVHVRIIGAEEALVDVTGYGDKDRRFVSGELTVRLLLSRASEERAAASKQG